MKEIKYLPEGRLIGKPENEAYISSPKMLERAMHEGKILEATAVHCEKDTLSLTVDLGGAIGIIPRSEAALEGNGDAEPKDISVITRVGRPVAFVVTDIVRKGDAVTAILSRKIAQARCRDEFISHLVPGDIVDGTVTHLDTFGAFVDVGCGIVSLLCIDCISVSRISHPSERLKKGEPLKVVIKSIDADGRIYVTLRELLGTWEENAAEFEIGSTVAGAVRSIEEYGIFVELSPNLAGLAERKHGVEVGDACAVYIKNIIPDRMKVKLSLIEAHSPSSTAAPLKYYVNTDETHHIDRWRYSPLVCPKTIETIF